MDQYSYIKLIKQLPTPTLIQIDNFIEMLSHHHSWYKHMSKEREYNFVIYLDPNAERTFRKITRTSVIETDHIFKEETYCEFIDIDKDKEGSHYQNSYGFWTYDVIHGIPEPFDPIEFNKGRSDSRPYLALHIVEESGLISPIPGEIIEKCTIKLYKYIHRCYSLDRYNGFDDNGEPANIIVQKHEEIIRDIKNHMLSIIQMIYG